MQELLEKYKYYIGSAISIILFYLIYKNFFNLDDKEIKKPIEEKNEIVKSEISHGEFLLFMETLKKEIQKLTQSMVKLNGNYIKTHNDYENFNKIFKKDIIKKNIIIDTMDNDGHSSNFIIDFGSGKPPGLEVFKNVIGFRLINASITYTSYTVHAHNNTLKINNGGVDWETITLPRGEHSFDDLALILEKGIREIPGGAYLYFKVTANDDLTYTISSGGTCTTGAETEAECVQSGGTWNHNEEFNIDWGTGTSTHKLFGFTDINISNEAIYTSDTIPDHSIHYVDLVIPEIPKIACKMSSKGKEIIARIPFNGPSGSVIYHRAPEDELQTSDYFYPIKLSKLSVQLYDDHDNIYDSNNGDNSFEFELTIVNNTGLLK